jgi:hypothetical protein
MNARNWANRREIRLLDLTALLDFKTDSSMSFHLGTYGIPPEFAGSHQAFIGKNTGAYFVIGWLDIHYPGEGHIKDRPLNNFPISHGGNHEAASPRQFVTIGRME